MSHNFRLSSFFVLFFLFVVVAIQAQAPAASQKAVAPDFSQESYVIEQMVTRMKFENDGTSRRELTMRVRMQDANAVQQFGQLAEGYNSANERLDYPYVRVRKQDGTVVPAPADAIQDVSGPIVRVAPVYSDYREKHVTVPGLRPGDTLEFQVVTTTTLALAAGQFWASYDFARPGGPIVLDERLEIDAPRERKITLKNAPEFSPKSADEGARRVYRWTSTHKVREGEEELKKLAKVTHDFPDVQLTTFDNWGQVGEWYASLERERRQPSPKVKEKAAALVAGRASEMEKTQALYDFVALNFRYVSLSFGVGRYQPHAAEEILANEYGDCKDKNTLLAALLDAVGIRSSSALVNSSRKIDPAVPSPGQFDHVITVARAGGEPMWMDTTTEVAPFRLLMPTLRNKRALVVPQDGPAALQTTPADAPFPQQATVELEGRISPLGKLEAHVSQQFRGDTELAFRLVFRSIGQPDWTKVLQFAVLQQGIDATVTEPSISDLTATDAPLKVGFNIEVPNFLDWAKKKTNVAFPLGSFTIPAIDEDSTEQIDLGGAGEFAVLIQLEMPEASTMHLPVPVRLVRDYAEYRSEYKQKGHTVVAERKLIVKQRELARSMAGDFAAFRRTIEQDQKQDITVDNSVASGPKVPESAKADELTTAGISAYDNQQFATAIDMLNRAVELDPKHKFAWNDLGRAYLATGRLDEAATAFRKQIEINPYDEWSYNNLGLVLRRQHKDDEAITAFTKQIEVTPLDKYAHKNLGHSYATRKNFGLAAEELAKAAQITPDDIEVQVELGNAYLEGGKTDEALGAFDKAVRIAPIPPIWAKIAYYLAQKKVALTRAQEYAESSVTYTEAMLRNLTAESMDSPQAAMGSFLASAWDTLGWVKFQQGDLDKAEEWLKAAWILEQHGEVGDHLAQLYEKRGDKSAATRLYAQALASPLPHQESRKRLAALLGSEKGIEGMVNKARSELSDQRTVRLGKLSKKSSSAEFTILLSSGPKVEVVKFVSGDEKLKELANKLESVPYDIIFPGTTPTKIAIRGFVSCSGLNGECMFVRGIGPPEGSTDMVFDMLTRP